MSTDDARTREMPAAEDHEPTLISLFPATPFPAFGASVRCPCGMPGCPDGSPLPGPSDPRALLSYAPGVTGRVSDARIRNGQYEDIPARWDDAYVKVHRPCHDARRAIGRDVADGRHHIGDVLDSEPGAHFDARIAEGLRALEAHLAARMAETRQWVARRAAETRGERTEAAA